MWLPVLPKLTPRADFFLHPLPASNLPFGTQNVADPSVSKSCGYQWAIAYMREGGREKSTATNAGFSLTVYLYVQG